MGAIQYPALSCSVSLLSSPLSWLVVRDVVARPNISPVFRAPGRQPTFTSTTSEMTTVGETPTWVTSCSLLGCPNIWISMKSGHLPSSVDSSLRSELRPTSSRGAGDSKRSLGGIVLSTWPSHASNTSRATSSRTRLCRMRTSLCALTGGASTSEYSSLPRSPCVSLLPSFNIPLGTSILPPLLIPSAASFGLRPQVEA